MKGRIVLLACMITCLLLPACRNRTTPPQLAEKPVKNNRAGTKPPGSYADTVIIKDPAALFYNADSIQLELIKAMSDSTVFNSLKHDCYYQMRNARNVIKASYPHIRVIETSKARWLLFITEKGHREFIDLDTVNDPCGIYLFDAVNSPRLADMTNIDTELGQYFSR